MPLYEFYCIPCDAIHEQISKIADRKQFIICPGCGASAERIISARIERVEPLWLDDAKRSLRPEDRHKITDRNDLTRYMRKEGINQI